MRTMKLIVDGYNCINGVENVLPWGVEANTVDLDFGRLADVIAARMQAPTIAVEITVHIGITDMFRDPCRYRHERARFDRWERDSRVTVRTRTLAFNAATGKSTEKGVDTALAIDLIRSQESGKYDDVNLFSADKDHAPALEEAFRPTGARISLSRWEGQTGLWLHDKKIWCHNLNTTDLAKCSINHYNKATA